MNIQEFEPIVVHGGNTPDLTFNGTLLASVSSYRPGYNRYTELRLYKTEAGAYVGQALGLSDLPGEVPRYRSSHGDIDTVLSIFKRDNQLSWLAKELLEEAGMSGLAMQQIA